MIQGTTSDAGKSVAVAAFCRYLANQGKRVAPFKPQNMALNSAVAEDGGELGRAQALQAQACKVSPHTDMNPILLKPSSDTGAQVIVHGKALTAMEAAAYHDYKKVAMEAVLASHARLCNRFDFVVVEGAGSPAEINLREGDIANMGFAEAVDCPVIIIADIDKGGVFAHLVGTLALLSESEQKRTVGFIINRFRGDISLLQSGLDWLEKKTGKPVLGVIPYLKEFFLDAEDAIDTQQVAVDNTKQALKIVVPVYPRISNHTDFDALRLNPYVDLQFIPPGQAVPPSDLIILPGTKNVRSDLQWLKTNAWDEHIKMHLRYGGKLMGICGGYQMLGELVSDPLGIEGPAGEERGLGLIPINTELREQKLTQIKKGRLNLKGTSVDIEGYEIHCGVSIFTQGRANLINYENQLEGYHSNDQQIIGTYLHGLFDNADACGKLLNWVLGSSSHDDVRTDEKGEDKITTTSMNENREYQLERLATCFEKHIDWDRLWTALKFDVSS